jgi:hypothetical protein
MVKHGNYRRSWQALWEQIYGITLRVIAERMYRLVFYFNCRLWRNVRIMNWQAIEGQFHFIILVMITGGGGWGGYWLVLYFSCINLNHDKDQSFHTAAGLSIKIYVTHRPSSSICYHINMPCRYFINSMSKLRKLDGPNIIHVQEACKRKRFSLIVDLLWFETLHIHIYIIFMYVFYIFMYLFYVYIFIVCLCILRLPWLRFIRAFSSVVRQMPG